MPLFRGDPSLRALRIGLTLATLATVAIAGDPDVALGQSRSVLTLLSTDGRSLAVGEDVSGALSSSDPRAPDDAPLEPWLLEAEAGQRMTIDLRSSDFDAYLYLVGPGFDETLRDDDGGGGCDARLVVTFLESGVFTVVASSRSRDTGPYTLSVSADSDPATPYSCGGVSPETLLELPTDERALSMGTLARGSFDGTEPTIQEGRPAAAWALDGRAGESVTVRLMSEAFDAYLHVFGPGMIEALSDDDSAGDLDSQITVDFPETGAYRVVASALSTGARGPYTLELLEPIDLGTLPTEGRQAVAGESVSGNLTTSAPVVVDGRPGQAWALDGLAGRSVTIELLSDDFDTYLYVVGPGLDAPMEDDDSAGDANSRVALTFPDSGAYRVIVSAFSSGSGGAFTIRVTPN